MAKGYWVCFYRAINKPEALAAYAAAARPAIEAEGGRYLAAGLPAQTYDAGLKQRTVLIEFPSVAAATACHDSPAYQAAVKHLAGGAVDRDLRIIESLE